MPRSTGPSMLEGTPSRSPTPAEGRGAITDLNLVERVEATLGPRYRIIRVAARSPDRVLFEGTDTLLKRHVSIRINIWSGQEARNWFLLEAEALAQLDHPAIRHVYDVGTSEELA